MTITATFIGADSAGYVHGKTYSLKVSQFRGMTIIKKVILKKEDEADRVCYASSIAFLKNWDNIKTKQA